MCAESGEQASGRPRGRPVADMQSATCDVRHAMEGAQRIFPPLFWCPVLFLLSCRPQAESQWEGLLWSSESRDLLDVLAVLDGAGQLCVESGVSCAATCSLGNGGVKRRDEAQRVL